MAIDSNIKSNLSIGAFNRPTQTVASPSGGRRGAAAALYGSISSYTSAATRIVQYQYPNDRPKFYTEIRIQTYKRTDLLSVEASLTTGTQLILPMPQQLTDSHEVTYSEESLGSIWGAGIHGASQAMGGVGGVVNSLNSGKTLGQLGQDFIQNADPNLAAGAGINAGLATGDALGAPASATLNALAGLKPNEFFTVLLKGPNYKRHELSWHLAPRNPIEAHTIKNIIALLNNNMAPGLAFGGAMFSFPKVFQIGLLPNYNYLYKFKPAVLESMTVEYTPNGQPPSFYHPTPGRDGSFDIADAPPESVQIRCRFIELEYWLHSDFKPDGDSPTDTRGEDRESENMLHDIVSPKIKEYSKAAGDWIKENMPPVGD